jgi:uncharacterized repeat protein (TIGR01451 family)
MTQPNTDKLMRSLFGGAGAVRLFVLISSLLLPAYAAAEVKLENTVQKVETFVNEEGETQRRLVDAISVVPGDELRYTITFTNAGTDVVDAQSVVITNPIPADTEYLEDTAFGAGTEIVFSLDGEAFAAPEALTVIEQGVEVSAAAKEYRSIRWTFQPELKPGESSYVSFNVRLK